VDLKQSFDAQERVTSEQRDSNGDCKLDTWLSFENGRLVLQAQDTKGLGKPDVLNHLDAKGNIIVQEVASDGRRPDKKIFLGPGGVVTSQCVLSDDGKRLNARALVQNGNVTSVLIDSRGKGVADTRQILRGGQLAELQADTNGDTVVDVVQYFAGADVRQQDEDTNFDGVVDQRFQGKAAVSVPPNTKVPGERFEQLGCGAFDRFWSKR